MEIINKADEWGEFDYQLAQKILDQKGKGLTKEKIEILKAERIKEISKPAKTKISFIILCYFLSIFFSPLGIFAGWTLAYSKRTLLDGQIVYSYDKTQRNHGEIIFILGCVLSAIYVASAIINNKKIWF
jgi:hypothetical protein